MATQPKTFYTPAEYLELERKAEYKNEYYNGEIFAMSGASRKHDRIALRLNILLGQHVLGRGCAAHTSDMRVLAAPGESFTYPDFSATCDEAKYVDENVDTLTNPSLIVEILSPSTEKYNHAKKARMYRAMPSVQELLLIAQDSCYVELLRRQNDGTWLLIEAKGLDSSIELTSIGYTLRLADLYENLPAD